MVDSIVGQANMIRSILGLPERELVEDTSQEEGKKPVVITGGSWTFIAESEHQITFALPSDICEFLKITVSVSTSLSTCMFYQLTKDCVKEPFPKQKQQTVGKETKKTSEEGSFLKL